MGEYFEWINVDKKEFISPRDFDYGNKLHESAHKGISFLKALKDLMTGEWKGDHIIFLGDETHIEDIKGNPILEKLEQQVKDDSVLNERPADMVCETYKNVSSLFKAAEAEVRAEIEGSLSEYYSPDFVNEYGFDIADPYKGFFEREGKDFQYTINRSKKVYYDAQSVKIDDRRGITDYMDPLPVLLHYGWRTVGPWVGDVIEFSDSEPEGYIRFDVIDCEKAEDGANSTPKETVSWSWFMDHCSDSTVEEMLKENVALSLDSPVKVDDFIFAMGELSGWFKKTIYSELIANGMEIKDELILEYFRSEGDDDLLLDLMWRFNGDYSQETMREFIQSGCERETAKKLVSGYQGKYSFEDVSEIINFIELSNYDLERILSNTEGQPTKDQVEEILDLLDESLYPMIKPYLDMLPFTDRVELRDMYDI